MITPEQLRNMSHLDLLKHEYVKQLRDENERLKEFIADLKQTIYVDAGECESCHLVLTKINQTE